MYCLPPAPATLPTSKDNRSILAPEQLEQPYSASLRPLSNLQTLLSYFHIPPTKTNTFLIFTQSPAPILLYAAPSLLRHKTRYRPAPVASTA
jgi:hypothetical protein